MADEFDYNQLAAALSGEYTPDQEAKLRALRGQSALGMLGSVAQGQTGVFGRSLYGDAEGERERMDEERTSGLERARMQMQIANEFRDLNTPADPLKQYDFKTVDKALYKVNPYTGKVERVGGGGGDGQAQSWMAQNEAGELVFDENAPPPQMDLKSDEGKAFNWVTTSMRSFRDIQNMFAEGFEPTMTSSLMAANTPGASSIARWTSDEMDQKYAASKIKIAESILRAETGAQAPEPEQVRAMVAWMPDYYEEPSMVRWKMGELRNRIMNTIPRAGGNAYEYLNAAGDHYMGPPPEEV